MDRHLIRCVHKTGRTGPHDKISHIGGLNPNGSRWKITQQMAIEGIDQGKWTFYIQLGNTAIDVIIHSHNGIRFLKPKTDEVFPNSLMNLPECP